MGPFYYSTRHTSSMVRKAHHKLLRVTSCKTINPELLTPKLTRDSRLETVNYLESGSSSNHFFPVENKRSMNPPELRLEWPFTLPASCFTGFLLRSRSSFSKPFITRPTPVAYMGLVTSSEDLV